MKKIIIMLIAAASVFTTGQAEEIGHLNGGVLDIRDYGNGDKISPVALKTLGGPMPVSVNVDIDMYALIPAIVWISNYKILGATYGGYLSPSFADNSLDADLAIATSFGVGVPHAQPLWLDWARQHWDLSLAYGFYAPVGNYNAQHVTLPGGANIMVQSRENIGLGYWTQQAQVGIAWYPMTNKATAVTAIGTFEYNGEQRDFDVRPGQLITVDWGVSQYLPLWKNHELLLQVGPAGYESYQINDSTGANALEATPKSLIHAAGGQLGLTYVPWNAFLTLRGFYQYAANSRFQGASIGLNFGIRF